MTTFVFAFRAPASAQGLDADSISKWQQFFEGLGPKLIDMGNPVFTRTPVGNCGQDTVLGGYSIIEADDLTAAVALTKNCPALTDGGGVEVGELTRLSDTSTATTVSDHARAGQTR